MATHTSHPVRTREMVDLGTLQDKTMATVTETEMEATKATDTQARPTAMGRGTHGHMATAKMETTAMVRTGDT